MRATKTKGEGHEREGAKESEYCTASLSVNVQVVRVAVPSLYIAPPCRIVFVVCSFVNACVIIIIIIREEEEGSQGIHAGGIKRECKSKQWFGVV